MYKVLIKELDYVNTCNNDKIEYFYLLDGSLDIEINEKKHRVKKGDLFIVNPFEARVIMPNKMKNLFIHLEISFEIFEGEKSYYKDIRLRNFIDKKNLEDKILELIYKIQVNTIEGVEQLYIHEEISRLVDLSVLYYSYKKHDIKNMRHKAKIIEESNRIISTIDFEDISLDRVAEEINISPSHFSRVFKEVTGMGFSRYNQLLKLQKSSELLIRSNMNMEEITEETGFMSTKSLNRIYNNYLSITPSEYRRDIKPIDFKSQEDYMASKGFYELDSKFDSYDYEKMYNKIFYKKRNPEEKIRYHLNTQDLVMKSDGFEFYSISLKTFGYNYIENIYQLNKFIDIKRIRLSLGVIDDECSIYSYDLGHSIHCGNLFSLLEFLDYLKIEIVLDIRYYKSKESHYCKMGDMASAYRGLDGIKKQLKKIIKVVSRSVMKNYTFVINGRDILKLSNNKTALRNYLNIMDKKLSIIEEVISFSDFKYVVELGEKEYSDIIILSRLIEEIGYDRFKPIYISYRLINPNAIEFHDISRIDRTYKRYIDSIRGIERIQEDLDKCQGTNYVLEGVRTFINSENIDDRYIELMLILYIMDIQFFSKDLSRSIKGNVVVSDLLDNRSFRSLMVDEDGFKTPLYFLAIFIEMMKGNVMRIEKSFMASNYDDNINLLFWGDLLIDYFYAVRHDYLNLDSHKRKVYIELDDIFGEYKEITWTLSVDSGSTKNLLRNYEDPKYMTPEEKKIVNNRNMPEKTVKYLKLDGKLKTSIELSPFNIVLRRYIRI